MWKHREKPFSDKTTCYEYFLFMQMYFSCKLQEAYAIFILKNKEELNKHTKKGQQKAESFHCITDVKQSRFFSITGYYKILDTVPCAVYREADRVLVLRHEPLRWQSRVQDISPPETSRPLVMSNCESSPRDLHLNAKTQLHSTTSKLQC